MTNNCIRLPFSTPGTSLGERRRARLKDSWTRKTAEFEYRYWGGGGGVQFDFGERTRTKGLPGAHAPVIAAVANYHVEWLLTLCLSTIRQNSFSFSPAELTFRFSIICPSNERLGHRLTRLVLQDVIFRVINEIWMLISRRSISLYFKRVNTQNKNNTLGERSVILLGFTFIT